MLQPGKLMLDSELGSSPEEMRLKKIFSDPKITKEFRDYIDNLKWLFANYEGLREEYGDMYVAVRDKKVYYASKEPLEFLARIRGKHGRDRSVVTEFISKEDELLVV